MEQLSFFCYTMGHETPWDPRGTGKASSTRDRDRERRQDDSFIHCAFGGSIQKLRFPMVPRVPTGWFRGPSFKSDSRTSSEAFSKGEKAIRETPFVWSAECRVSNRPLDLGTNCSNHPQAIWYPLSPPSCVAGASRDGMELPETRAARFAKERERDCAVESLSVAPYKKKPKELGPGWSSSMNLASCSFPTSVARGLPKGEPRSSIPSTNRAGFPPSVLCRCPRNGNAWLFISGFGRGILTVWMSVVSFKNCSNISRAPWSCCGTGEPSIDVKKSNSFSLNIRGFIWNTFQPMRLNLTPQNMSGIKPIVPSPIVYQRDWPNSKQCYKIRHESSGNPKDFFGHASLPRIFLGPDRSFHYLCETQY